MSGIEKPTTFKDAILIARDLTAPPSQEHDERSEFEVYLDVARRLKWTEIGHALDKVPASDEHKRQLIKAEAYGLAQSSHLEDEKQHTPNRLVDMLDGLAVFAFDCLKHCTRKNQLYDDTGIAFNNRRGREQIVFRLPFGGPFSFMDIQDSLKQALGEEAPSTFEFNPFSGAALHCRISPDCQEACPLPEPNTERYQQVIDTTVEGVIARYQPIES